MKLYMRRNNKTLYEQIMRNVSREIKKTLLETENYHGEDYIDDNGNYNIFKDEQFLNDFAEKIWTGDYQIFDKFDKFDSRLIEACTDNPEGVEALMYNVVTRCSFDINDLAIEEVKMYKKYPEIIRNTTEQEFRDYEFYLDDVWYIDCEGYEFNLYDHILSLGGNKNLIITFCNSKLTKILVQMLLKFVVLCLKTQNIELINDDFLDTRHILTSAGLSNMMLTKLFMTKSIYKGVGTGFMNKILGHYKNRETMFEPNVMDHLSNVPIILALSVVEDIASDMVEY